jgi:two-component system cell cycle response regulator DivK
MLSRAVHAAISTLPLLAATPKDDDPAPKVDVSPIEHQAAPDAPIILVVDDDVPNLMLAQALLEAEGFQVRVAVNGATMFDVLQQCTPAVILMDIQLPESDGWELTQQLKADPATTNIPVIAITAYGKAGDVQKARQAGFAEFLSKPVSTRELPAIIRRHLQAN